MQDDRITEDNMDSLDTVPDTKVEETKDEVVHPESEQVVIARPTIESKRDEILAYLEGFGVSGNPYSKMNKTDLLKVLDRVEKGETPIEPTAKVVTAEEEKEEDKKDGLEVAVAPRGETADFEERVVVRRKYRKPAELVARDAQLTIKQKLASEPQVRMYVPLGFKEREGSKISVMIGGVKFEYVKNTWFDCPKSVAEMLERRMNITKNVGNDISLSNEAHLNQKKDGVTLQEALTR